MAAFLWLTLSVDLLDFSSYVGENREKIINCFCPFWAGLSHLFSQACQQILRKGFRISPSVRSRKKQLGAPGWCTCTGSHQLRSCWLNHNFPVNLQHQCLAQEVETAGHLPASLSPAARDKEIMKQTEIRKWKLLWKWKLKEKAL